MFQTHTREHKTPLIVQAYADENKTQVVATAEGIGRVIVAVLDLADPLPADLPVAAPAASPNLPPELPPSVKASVEQHEAAPTAPAVEPAPAHAEVPAESPAPTPSAVTSDAPAPTPPAKKPVKKPAAPKKAVAPKPAAVKKVAVKKVVATKVDPNLPLTFGRGRPKAVFHVMVKGVYKSPLLAKDGGNENVALAAAHEHGAKNVFVSYGVPPIQEWMPFATYIKKRDSILAIKPKLPKK